MGIMTWWKAVLRRSHRFFSASFVSGSSSAIERCSSSSHFDRFSSSMSTHVCMSGRMLETAMKSGATIKSMKLSDSCACFVVSRSMLGDTGRPSAFSRSPWAKNSLHTRSLHSLPVSQGLHGLLMSAECSSVLISTSRSAGGMRDASARTSSPPVPSDARRFAHSLSSAVSPKWHVMSVARIDLMMSLRAELYCAVGSLPSTLNSRMMRNATTQ
mmetsp:Transcript_9271/g.32676  ORF Transcript_9271/g.32676 Transcript_9271/m.32676 type:complete len:214 (+) Transcript_9271:365-1006(+)